MESTASITTFQKPTNPNFIGNDLVEQNKTDVTFGTPINLSNDQKSQNPRIVASGHHVYALPVFCPIDYQFDMNRTDYNAGETVVLGVVSPYGQDCLNNPTQITLQIFDYTKKSQEKPVFKETKQAKDRAEFNFTLPEPTSDYTPHRYLAKISFPIEKNIVATKERVFYAQDFAKTPSYDFQIWPYKSEVPSGVSSAYVISKICPFFPPADIGKEAKRILENQVTDPGSEILMKFYFSSPSGSQIITSETVDPNSDCTETWARGFILPNETGTWSVYSTAQWTQQNSIKELQSKTIDFLVKEPVTAEYKITKLVSLDDIKKSAHQSGKIQLQKVSVDSSTIPAKKGAA
jgi:hypothetical protein